MDHPIGSLDVKMLLGILQREMGLEPTGDGRSALPIAWASTRGSVRHENQDRLLVAQGPNGITITVLADGMGGMKEGALAAAVAASACVAYCVTVRSSSVSQLLVDALLFANQEVFRILHGSGGAALVLAAWGNAQWYVAHAGDARAYHIGNDSQLKQLTVDDTVRGQLQDQGRPSNQESALHTQLLQFIGVGKDFEPHVSRVAETGRGLLLTSDGVHGGVPAQVMDWVVRKSQHLQDVVRRLVAASEWSGGHDNATSVAISFASFQSSHTGLQPFAEIWLPGNHHLVIPLPERLQMLSREQPPLRTQGRVRSQSQERPKPRLQNGESIPDPKRDKTRKQSLIEPPPPREHHVPIVAFGQSATTDAEPSISEGAENTQSDRSGDQNE